MKDLHGHDWKRSLSRRRLLETSGLGFGSLALTSLLGTQISHASEGSVASVIDLKARPPHFPPRAKAVIQLMQNGGPSQMDLFDHKPDLSKHSGKPHPQEVETFSPKKNKNVLLGTPFRFQKYGHCGMELSEVIPQMGSVADELCLVRSMYTEHNNHSESLTMMQTCKIFPGRPTMGAWVTYALGTENQNLPAYIVLRDPAGYNTDGRLVWSSGFLPALYQGVEFNSAGSPVHHLNPEFPLPPGAQRNDLAALAELNKLHYRNHPQESELESRIQNYELAAQMQLAAADVLDLSKESAETKKLYGLDNPMTAGYGTRCLMARRLVEAGVRFVQIFPPLDPSVQPWDQHNDLKKGLETICARTDGPFAALIRDLRGRGLLDSTLVMWTGEFGRLPITESDSGRDHNRNAFTTVLAGAGFKKGFVYGATDEFGYKAVQDRMSVPDLHATVLWRLGLDHQKVVYKHQGITETETDTRVHKARVVEELFG